MKVTCCPEAGTVGIRVKSGDTGCAATVKLAVPCWKRMLASVAVTVTVWLPFAAKVVV